MCNNVIALQCFEYKQNRLSGSLCSPLCSKEITVTKCLGHGVKPHVLEAKWKDKRIVLKSESPIPDFHEYLPKVQDKGKFKMKVKYLLQYVSLVIEHLICILMCLCACVIVQTVTSWKLSYIKIIQSFLPEIVIANYSLFNSQYKLIIT